MNDRIGIIQLTPPNALIVELGVWYGDFMLDIARERPQGQYVGIDRWEGRFGSAELIARGRAVALPNCQLIKGDTALEASSFPDNHIDLVYIDAFHTEESCTLDILAWWPKVKSGGILAGHDYENKPATQEWEQIGVKDAVDKWSNIMGLTVHSTDEGCPSWWVLKP